MPQFNTHTAGQADQILVIQLPPKLTDEVAAPVREAAQSRLPNADGAALIVDCRLLELINSIGITCLLQIQDHCAQRQARFILAQIPEPILRFLTTLKLDERFETADDVDQAIADCAP